MTFLKNLPEKGLLKTLIKRKKNSFFSGLISVKEELKKSNFWLTLLFICLKGFFFVDYNYKKLYSRSKKLKQKEPLVGCLIINKNDFKVVFSGWKWTFDYHIGNRVFQDMSHETIFLWWLSPPQGSSVFPPPPLS